MSSRSRLIPGQWWPWAVAQQIWTESDNFDFLAGGGERGQWGKLFGNATFAGRNGRLTASSNKICCGETFSVFNWLKPNLVCLLGNRVNDHPPTHRQKSDNYKWPLAFKRKSDNDEMLRFFSKLYMCCIWTFPMFVKNLVKIVQILRKLWRFSVSRDYKLIRHWMLCSRFICESPVLAVANMCSTSMI